MLDASAKQGLLKPIRLVIVDRQPIVLQGLKSILGTQQDFDVVASISDGPSCLEAIRKLSPDVALIGDSLPDLTVSEILAIAKAEKLSTRLVFFTDSDGDRDLTAAIATGACSAISKYAAPATMLQSLRLMGKSGVSLESSDLAPAGREDDGGGKLEKMLELLTSRERQIVRLVAEGMSNKEIARRLDVSHGTVKVHLHNIFQKLEITNRTMLATISWLQRTSGFVALALAFLAFAIADELKAAEASDNLGHDDGPGEANDHAGYDVWKKAILAHLVISKSAETSPFTEKDLFAKASHAAGPVAAMEALRAAEQLLGSKVWKNVGPGGSGTGNLPAFLQHANHDTEAGDGAALAHRIPQLASTSTSVSGGYGTFAALAGALIYALSDPHLAAHAGEVSKASIESLLNGIGENATAQLATASDADAHHTGSGVPNSLSQDLHPAFVIPAISVTKEGAHSSDEAGHNLQTPISLVDAGHASGLGGDSLDQAMWGRVDDIVHRSPSDTRSDSSDPVVDGASGPGRLNLAAFGALAWLHLTAAAKSIPPHTLAWVYDPASNQTIVYVNPTDHVLDIGDRGLVEVHLQGIVSVAEADVVHQADGAVHAATLEQLEQALMPAAATDEAGPHTNGSDTSEDSLGTASVWSASADDGSSFQFAAVRSGAGTSATSGSSTRDSAETSEESAGSSAVSSCGSSSPPGRGVPSLTAGTGPSQSEPVNSNPGAQPTKQAEMVQSGFQTADSGGPGNSEHASNPGASKAAAAETAQGKSNSGSDVGNANGAENGNGHHAEQADGPPGAAKAPKPDVDHGKSGHAASGQGPHAAEVAELTVVPSDKGDHGHSPHAAQPKSAQAPDAETAGSKPGHGHDDPHHSQTQDSPPKTVAESGSAKHGNSDHSTSAKTVEAGESGAGPGPTEHGPHAAEPGAAKAEATEMAEAKPASGNGTGHGNEHHSQALDGPPAGAKTADSGKAEHGNPGHSGPAKEADAEGAAPDDTDHGHVQRAALTASNASEPAQPAKAAFAFGGADLVFRFDGAAASSTSVTVVEPKEIHNPHAALTPEDDLRTIVEAVPHGPDEHAAQHGDHAPHPGIQPAHHDLLV